MGWNITPVSPAPSSGASINSSGKVTIKRNEDEANRVYTVTYSDDYQSGSANITVVPCDAPVPPTPDCSSYGVEAGPMPPGTGITDNSGCGGNQPNISANTNTLELYYSNTDGTANWIHINRIEEFPNDPGKYMYLCTWEPNSEDGRRSNTPVFMIPNTECYFTGQTITQLVKSTCAIWTVKYESGPFIRDLKFEFTTNGGHLTYPGVGPISSGNQYKITTESGSYYNGRVSSLDIQDSSCSDNPTDPRVITVTDAGNNTLIVRCSCIQ